MFMSILTTVSVLLLLFIIVQGTRLALLEHKQKYNISPPEKPKAPNSSSTDDLTKAPNSTINIEVKFQDKSVYVDVHSVLLALKEESPFKEEDDILLSLETGSMYSITGAGNFMLGFAHPRIVQKAKELSKKDLCMFNAEAIVYTDSKGRLSWEY